jgi:hypothetical protein
MGKIHHLKSFLCLGDTVIMLRHLERHGESRSSDVLVVVYKCRISNAYVSVQTVAVIEYHLVHNLRYRLLSLPT